MLLLTLFSYKTNSSAWKMFISDTCALHNFRPSYYDVNFDAACCCSALPVVVLLTLLCVLFVCVDFCFCFAFSHTNNNNTTPL